MKTYFKARYIVSFLYLLGGVATWLEFANSPPDGLANVLIALYVFPITAIGVWLRQEFPPFVPTSLTYYKAHAAFFFPSLFVMTVLIFLTCALVARFLGGPRTEG